MSYEQDTRAAYRSQARAAAYRHRQTHAWSWARLATWREQARLARVLRGLGLNERALVLDVPCGTGILGRLLGGFSCRVVASDISTEMMALARAEYRADRFKGFLQSDILRLPFSPGSFDCVVVLGFLHRVPAEIRRRSLREAAAVSKRSVVVTCSIDNAAQRIKARALRLLNPGYRPAPHRAPLSDVLADCAAVRLRVAGLFRPLPVLSSEVVLLLEKEGRATA
jgi:SAM-dependent methyltransferase